MKKILLASVLTAAFATAAYAAGDVHFYLVKDSVGNCSAIASDGAPGAKPIDDKPYDSMDAANKALDGLPKGTCENLIH